MLVSDDAFVALVESLLPDGEIMPSALLAAIRRARDESR
jgi:hypothetical protein